jgi:DNA repair protein RecO (recombination protein O)
MEQWRDQGLVLAARPHGESGAVVSVLTEGHGRYNGYVRGGQGSRQRGTLQPGTLVSVDWGARVADSLGTFVLEPERQLAPHLMDDPLKLGALGAACSLCDSALPEREGHPGLYHGLVALLDMMDSEAWGAAYVMWELALLRELGFGINLTRCAGGGDPAHLAWVSPKSGCAVSEEAAGPWKDRLLPLPAFLKPVRGEAGPAEVLKGLRMTGHFLEHWVYAQHSRGIPDDRLRFEERFARYVDRILPPEAAESRAE